jgi:hypothetical protein
MNPAPGLLVLAPPLSLAFLLPLVVLVEERPFEEDDDDDEDNDDEGGGFKFTKP